MAGFAKPPTPVVKVDKFTREIVAEYPSYGKAAKSEGYGVDRIYRNVTDMSLSAGRHYFRRKDSFDPDEDFTRRRNCPVAAMDVRTSQVRLFSCSKALAAHLGVSPTRVTDALRAGLPVRNHVVRYVPHRMEVGDGY